MKTQAEIAASKMLRNDTCLNCQSSTTGFKRKQPALKCSLTDQAVSPHMIGCFYWKRKDG